MKNNFINPTRIRHRLEIKSIRSCDYEHRLWRLRSWGKAQASSLPPYSSCVAVIFTIRIKVSWRSPERSILTYTLSIGKCCLCNPSGSACAILLDQNVSVLVHRSFAFYKQSPNFAPRDTHSHRLNLYYREKKMIRVRLGMSVRFRSVRSSFSSSDKFSKYVNFYCKKVLAVKRTVVCARRGEAFVHRKKIRNKNLIVFRSSFRQLPLLVGQEISYRFPWDRDSRLILSSLFLVVRGSQKWDSYMQNQDMP